MNAATKLSAKAKRFFAPREKFLVLEVTPRGTDALFLSVDEDRNVIFEKSVRNANLKKFLGSPLRRMSQKSWEGNYLFKSHRKVIVSADSSVATTMPIPLDLARERSRSKEEITINELENLIAQAMAKIFTQCRSEAAKRLGVDDIHTILVGAKTDRFRIDGHAVMNPIGFTGKKISLSLELTFTGREIFESLKQFFNSPEEFFFIESPQAWMLSVARARPLPLGLIATGGGRTGDAGGTMFFVFQEIGDGRPVLYREKLNWSFDAVFQHIAQELGVDAETAVELYRIYRAGGLSAAAERNFQKMIQGATERLLDEIENAKTRGFVYLDAEHPAPFDLPRKYKGVMFEDLPIDEVLAALDLTADPISWSRAPQRTFRNLAPFLEAYVAKNTSEINQKLRRRLHWLAE